MATDENARWDHCRGTGILPVFIARGRRTDVGFRPKAPVHGQDAHATTNPLHRCESVSSVAAEPLLFFASVRVHSRVAAHYDSIDAITPSPRAASFIVRRTSAAFASYAAAPPASPIC